MVIFYLLSLLVFMTLHLGNAGPYPCSVDGCRDGPGNLKCQSCISGCHRENCKHVCRGKCDIDGCNRTTGDCLKCEPGFHGDRCDRPCPEGCMSNIDDGIADCDRKTGACLEYCAFGKTGSQCSENCPAKCRNSVCTKAGGKCFMGCTEGWAGTYCNKSCQNCQHGRCKSNGHCTVNCKPGFYGDSCEKKCSNCYLTGCDRRTGICEQCSPGYYGTNCDHKCHDNCYQERDGYRNCDRYNGSCLSGCESGWHGSHCKTACSSNCQSNRCHSHDGYCTFPCEPGRYGSHCNSNCSNSCKCGCNRHTGVCIHGCKNTEERSRCPDGLSGINCSKNCNIHCINNICSVTGTCLHGCYSGYHGHDCQFRCDVNCQLCSQISGYCHRCNEPYHIENGTCKPNIHTSGASHICSSISMLIFIYSCIYCIMSSHLSCCA